MHPASEPDHKSGDRENGASPAGIVALPNSSPVEPASTRVEQSSHLCKAHIAELEAELRASREQDARTCLSLDSATDYAIVIMDANGCVTSWNVADRAGAHRAMIKYVQTATRAEVNRFRNYGSAGVVIDGFGRSLRSKPTQDIHSELKLRHLPVINEFRDGFERKACELGLDPNNFLTSLFSDSDKNT